MPETVIVPDVSRHVHFIPGPEEHGVMVRVGSQPFHAVVIFVHNERTVNLSITDHAGDVHARAAVQLVQPGDEAPAGSHCRWMPYQVAQHAPVVVIEPMATSPAAPPAGDGGGVSPILAGLIATTAASLTAQDLQGIQVEADGNVAATTDSQAGGDTNVAAG